MSTDPLVDPHACLVNVNDPCLMLLDNFDNDSRKLSKSSDNFILRAHYTREEKEFYTIKPH
jgi:hypothetical protein